MNILHYLCCVSICVASLCDLHSASAQAPPLTGEEGKSLIEDHIKPVDLKTPASEKRKRIIPRKESKRTTPVEPESFVWKSTEQSESCTKNLKILRGYYTQSRHYSIQGDACACAVYARKFLDLKQKIELECPSEFLTGNGFPEDIVRNIRLLEELGADLCFGSAGPYHPAGNPSGASRKIAPPSP